MSKFIGIVRPHEAPTNYIAGAHVVYVSLGGVELHSDEKTTLTPLEARVFAAYLTTAAQEADEMRIALKAQDVMTGDVPLEILENVLKNLQDALRRRKEGK
jgi:hypothetical protein